MTTTTFTELSPLLKSLRLSGILDSLDTRNRQAIQGKLAYTEFLALLVNDELARREQKKLALRLRRAAFGSAKTIEQFDFDALPKLNRALVQDLLTGRFVAEHAPILIAGPIGTGKSHLAQALGHQAVRQGHEVLFLTQSGLLSSLARARLAGSYERRMQTLARVPVLIVDDFGLKPLRAPHDEDFHQIIDARYERGALIVTSNLHFDEWHEVFPDNKLLGAATIDRMRHDAYRLVLDGPTRRKPRPDPSQPATTAPPPQRKSTAR
jgi:DNA replication protein DnaC